MAKRKSGGSGSNGLGLSGGSLAGLFGRQPSKGHKYNAVPTVVDGHTFPSKKEARRWCELKLLQMAGKISHLVKQQPYHCYVGGVKVCTYWSDFEYVENGELVVEDSKGVRTPVYKLKARLVKALYGITIKET